MENIYKNKNRRVPGKKISLDWAKKTEKEFDERANDFGAFPKATGSIKLRNEVRKKVGELLVYKKNILEVGVGNGLMFEYLKKKVSYTGLDLSVKMLTQAKKRALQYSISFYPIQGNAIDLPFKENSFDSTICIDTLHHIPPEMVNRVVEELIRVTKKNGQILLEIKNGLNLIVRYLYWEAQKRGALIMHPLNPFAVKRYINKKNLKIRTYFIGPGYWLAPFLLFEIRV